MNRKPTSMSGKSWVASAAAAYIAFFITVFASMAAAARGRRIMRGLCCDALRGGQPVPKAVDGRKALETVVGSE